MSKNLKTIVRSVRELSSNEKLEGLACLDRFTIQAPAIIDAYQSNPYLVSQDRVAEMIGVMNGRVIGSIGALPMRMIADGIPYETVANPNIKVDSEYRGTGLALDLLDFGYQDSKDKIRLDFYVSKVARKVVKLWGGSVFDIRQFALVRRSSLFFSERLPKKFSFLGCLLLDIVFFFHRLYLKMVLLRTISWEVELADDDGSLHEFAELVRMDGHRFRTDVSEVFLNWILKHDFRGITIADKHLWRIVKGGQTIGFVLMRKDHTARGRIIDWQAIKEYEHVLPLIILKSAMKMLAQCKAVVLSFGAVDECLVQYFARRCPRLPTQAATISVESGSPLENHEGWRDPKNWRIRPTMGDSCLF